MIECKKLRLPHFIILSERKGLIEIFTQRVREKPMASMIRSYAAINDEAKVTH
jgi:hypothetical protein